MKEFLFMLIISSNLSFAQNTKEPINFECAKSFTTIDFKPFVWKSSFANKNACLTSFNPTTGINNKYTMVGNNYFLSNTKTFSTLNAFDLNRKDSFNPNGTTNLGSALIFGVLNLIFENN